jgi:hypothetical protein
MSSFTQPYLVDNVFFDGYVLEFTEGFKNIAKKELVRFVRNSIRLKESRQTDLIRSMRKS